ncbi:Hypothetical predicted protein [Marmota monax]|uniref:Uncharacterized protein n=1 Tax=Marmota monax TaxID=9995 RepID=A0A5E4CJR4_MARMO|nr:Hypothetical predicted protein [Marmota monax]
MKAHKQGEKEVIHDHPGGANISRLPRTWDSHPTMQDPHATLPATNTAPRPPPHKLAPSAPRTPAPGSRQNPAQPATSKGRGHTSKPCPRPLPQQHEEPSPTREIPAPAGAPDPPPTNPRALPLNARVATPARAKNPTATRHASPTPKHTRQRQMDG